jgi:hypothetical protein
MAIVSRPTKNTAVPTRARTSLLDKLHVPFPIQLDALLYTLNTVSTRMAKPAAARTAPETTILILPFFKRNTCYKAILTLAESKRASRSRRDTIQSVINPSEAGVNIHDRIILHRTSHAEVTSLPKQLVLDPRMKITS